MNNLKAELILIRHGETAWNAAGRMQGHLDIPLNEAGRAQAMALAARFDAETVDAIYSSDLDRAYRTAEPVAAHCNRTIERDSRLRERHLGVLQGLTRDEAMARESAAWNAFKTGHPDTPIEGGESLNAFFQRVSALLSELAERHAGGRIVLVTHGGVLNSAYRQATGMPLGAPRNFPIRNASINVLTCCARLWRIERWGDISHLPDAVAAEAPCDAAR